MKKKLNVSTLLERSQSVGLKIQRFAKKIKRSTFAHLMRTLKPISGQDEAEHWPAFPHTAIKTNTTIWAPQSRVPTVPSPLMHNLGCPRRNFTVFIRIHIWIAVRLSQSFHQWKGKTVKPLITTSVVLVCSVILCSSCRTERALWIEVNEPGGRTTIAVTEAIARRFLEAMETKISFMKRTRRELVTRDMVRAVLDGGEHSITVRDEQGTEVTMSMKPLNIPGVSRGKNRLVLDISKSGEQQFHLALPELDIKLIDEETISLHADVDWKAWLPFLAKAGGAVYIKTHDEETEVWAYVE